MSRFFTAIRFPSSTSHTVEFKYIPSILSPAKVLAISKPRMPPNRFSFSKKKNWCVCILNCPPILSLLSITMLSTPYLLNSSRTAKPAGPAPTMTTVVRSIFRVSCPCASQRSGISPCASSLTSFTPSTFVTQIRRTLPSTSISQAPHLPIPQANERPRPSMLWLCTG